MLGHGRLRHSGYGSQLTCGEGLTAHQGSKHRRPRRVSDESSDFDEICGSDHCISRYDADKPNKHLEFGRGRTGERPIDGSVSPTQCVETPMDKHIFRVEPYASFAEKRNGIAST